MRDTPPAELLTWLRANAYPGDSLDQFRAMPLDHKLELLFLLMLTLGRSVVDLERTIDEGNADNRRFTSHWLVDLWRQARRWVTT